MSAPDTDLLYADLRAVLERHGIGWAVDGVMDSLECEGLLDDDGAGETR